MRDSDRVEPDAETRTRETALLGCVLILSMADFRMASGMDVDGSATVAHVVGRVGEFARIAPLVRFRDSAAADDPAAASLTALHGELRRLQPLMSRLARPAV
ncbi:MAG TPA: hypothetical protein VL358_04740 [Caulobacteraceae bacterium]|jgi:hypothetical protein|nr:hypothetical protein [Caulobacteraceae bacterium]